MWKNVICRNLNLSVISCYFLSQPHLHRPEWVSAHPCRWEIIFLLIFLPHTLSDCSHYSFEISNHPLCSFFVYSSNLLIANTNPYFPHSIPLWTLWMVIFTAFSISDKSWLPWIHSLFLWSPDARMYPFGGTNPERHGKIQRSFRHMIKLSHAESVRLASHIECQIRPKVQEIYKTISSGYLLSSWNTENMKTSHHKMNWGNISCNKPFYILNPTEFWM